MGATLFFIASKTFGLLAIPSTLFGGIGALGLLMLATRYKRAGRALAFTALAALLVLGFSPVARLLMHGLESRFPAWQGGGPEPTGIVVLGGAINNPLSEVHGTTVTEEAAERLTYAVELARRYPHARIIYSSGDASLRRAEPHEAAFARRFFVTMGIPAERVELEDQSRNTAENAEFSKAVARPQPGERWLLVTSAFHMPRSMGLFRHVGFAVEAAPTAWRTGVTLAQNLVPFRYPSMGLRMIDVAVREWTGLVVYRLTGRTAELLPGATPAKP